jgi:myo-inositol catabolism protein IolC
MTLGHDEKLYILAFDHRGSFQKKFFGIEGEPDPEQTAIIADAKHLIFEGMLQAVGAGADPATAGVLVDEQFGSNVPEQAREKGLKLAMPAERSGQNTFDFQYGEDFPAHIERFDPDFTKVLVRYNPDGDAAANHDQLERLKRLSDWLGGHERKFLFELLAVRSGVALGVVADEHLREVRVEALDVRGELLAVLEVEHVLSRALGGHRELQPPRIGLLGHGGAELLVDEHA